jgi:hypothetical protein
MKQIQKLQRIWMVASGYIPNCEPIGGNTIPGKETPEA